MSWFINHRPGATIERHSLSHALAGVPAPSEREPGTSCTIHPTAWKPQDFGRFSSPLRKLRRVYILLFNGRHSLSFAFAQQLPQGGSREGGALFNVPPKNRNFSGEFHRPDFKCYTYFLQAVLCYCNSADSRGGNLRNKCFYDLFNLHRRLRSLSMLSAFWASWRIAILSPSTMADCRLSTASDKSKSISASASLLTGSL